MEAIAYRVVHLHRERQGIPAVLSGVFPNGENRFEIGIPLLQVEVKTLNDAHGSMETVKLFSGSPGLASMRCMLP